MPTENKTKICGKCKIPKDRTDFYEEKKKYDGLSWHCKTCACEAAGVWYLKNMERALAYMP